MEKTLVDKSIVLTDSVIDDLLDDWFERDGETFLKIRKKGRIGWESTLEKDEAYSAYILEAPTMDDLIKRAYQLATEMIIVMDPPFKVTVHITNKGKEGMSGTDGKHVYINTAMFDDGELSVGEKLDTFLGTTIHEGCHLLYTDFKYLTKFVKPIIKDLWNIIEDERIEELLGENKPGLANFLEKSKYYYFDQFYLDYIVPREKDMSLTPLDRIVNCFLHIIRYPKYLKESEIVEFGHYLIAIKKVLNPYPITTKDAFEAAHKVFDIIKEFYVEEESKSKEGDGEGTEGEGTGKSKEEIKKDALDKLEKDSERLSEALKGIGDAPTSVTIYDGGKDLKGSDMASAVKKDGGLLGELCEGTVELGGSKDTFFSRVADNKILYMESVNRIRRYIPAIAKILKGHCKEYKLIHRSMRSGVLDTCKLAEAFQGVPTVYMREGEVKTDKVSVCVLIDESGSMNGSRIAAARDTAILINEAIGNISNVELFIYGHSGDNRRSMSTEMFVYREKGYNPRYALGSVTAKAENRDGIAIVETAKRVRKQTKNHVLFFILSDGAPCACSYHGESAMTHVKHCVSEVEKMNFSVIQVCISHTYEPGKMFKNYVILEDMSTLAFELGKVIKKATMSAAKEHVI